MLPYVRLLVALEKHLLALVEHRGREADRPRSRASGASPFTRFCSSTPPPSSRRRPRCCDPRDGRAARSGGRGRRRRAGGRRRPAASGERRRRRRGRGRRRRAAATVEARALRRRDAAHPDGVLARAARRGDDDGVAAAASWPAARHRPPRAQGAERPVPRRDVASPAAAPPRKTGDGRRVGVRQWLNALQCSVALRPTGVHTRRWQGAERGGGPPRRNSRRHSSRTRAHGARAGLGSAGRESRSGGGNRKSGSRRRSRSRERDGEGGGGGARRRSRSRSRSWQIRAEGARRRGRRAGGALHAALRWLEDGVYALPPPVDAHADAEHDGGGVGGASSATRGAASLSATYPGPGRAPLHPRR